MPDQAMMLGLLEIWHTYLPNKFYLHDRPISSLISSCPRSVARLNTHLNLLGHVGGQDGSG